MFDCVYQTETHAHTYFKNVLSDILSQGIYDNQLLWGVE